jgi:CrcB protein
MGDTDEPHILPIDPDLDGPSNHVRAPLRVDVLAAISVGGALGASARYGIERAIPAASDGFPWATFLINVSGSLVLGVFLVVVLERLRPSHYLRPFVATGFIGSFTTFSTFAVETDLLIKGGHIATAAAYMVSTLTVGLLCAWLGLGVGRLFIGSHTDRRARAG